MLASIGQESNRPYIGRFTNAIDELSLEYDKMQNAKESELPKSISSYLTYVTYIEQYSPSATFYDGPAVSTLEATRVLNALNMLEGMAISLISEKREFRIFERTSGIEGFISHVFHLPAYPMTLTKIRNGFKIINDMKAYVENRPSYDLSGMISMK